MENAQVPVFVVEGHCINVLKDSDWIFLSKFRVKEFNSSKNDNSDNSDSEDDDGKKNKKRKKGPQKKKDVFKPVDIYLCGNTAKFITSPIFSFVIRISPVFNDKISQYYKCVKISRVHALDDYMENFDNHNLFEVNSILVSTKSNAFNSIYTIKESIKNSEYFGPILNEAIRDMKRLKRLDKSDPMSSGYDQEKDEELIKKSKYLNGHIENLITQPLKNAFDLGKPSDFLEEKHVEYIVERAYRSSNSSSTTSNRFENSPNFYDKNVKYIFNNMFKDGEYFNMVVDLGGTLMLYISEEEAQQIITDNINKTKVLIRICTIFRIDQETAGLFMKNATHSEQENEQRVAVKIIVDMSYIYHDLMKSVREYGHTFIYEKNWSSEVRSFLSNNFSGEGSSDAVVNQGRGYLSDLGRYIRVANPNLACLRVYYNARTNKYMVSANSIATVERMLASKLASMECITVCKAYIDDVCVGNTNQQNNSDMYFHRIRELVSLHGRDKAVILCSMERRAYFVKKMTMARIVYIKSGTDTFVQLADQQAELDLNKIETLIVDRSHIMGIPQFAKMVSEFRNVKSLFLCGIPCCFPETLGNPLRSITKTRVPEKIHMINWTTKFDLLMEAGSPFKKIRGYIDDINQVLNFPKNLNVSFETNFVVVCANYFEKEEVLNSLRVPFAREVIRKAGAIKTPQEITYSLVPPSLIIIKVNSFSEKPITKPQFMKAVNWSSPGEGTVMILGRREDVSTILKGKYLNRYSTLQNQIRDKILDDMHFENGESAKKYYNGTSTLSKSEEGTTIAGNLSNRTNLNEEDDADEYFDIDEI
jgi:hypothetical protein